MGDYLNYRLDGTPLEPFNKTRYLSETAVFVGIYAPAGPDWIPATPHDSIENYRTIDDLTQTEYLIAVVVNSAFEAALIMKTPQDFDAVWTGIEDGTEKRIVSFYRLNRALADQMHHPKKQTKTDQRESTGESESESESEQNAARESSQPK